MSARGRSPRSAEKSRAHHLLDLSAQEVSARIAQNWQWDILFYEAVIIDILPFADLVQQGITQQFPQVPLAAR